MLKVHTNDGLTHEVDLRDERTYETWRRRFNDTAFQLSITGLTVVQRGVQYSLPKPQLEASALVAEPVLNGKGGERILCFTKDVQVTLMVHDGQKAARVTVTAPGKRKHAPR